MLGLSEVCDFELAHRPMCWKHFIWRQPGTGVGGTTVVPGITRQISKLFCIKAAQIRDNWFAIHTSGFNYDWLQLKEVIVFLAFYSFGLCRCIAYLNGAVLIVELSKGVNNCRVGKLSSRCPWLVGNLYHKQGSDKNFSYTWQRAAR